MASEILPEFEVRRAAKVLLRADDEKLVFVAGRRGMFNLPGGGIDSVVTSDGVREEAAMSALYRELQEELGIHENQVRDVEEVCGTWDIVTPERGRAKLAVWSVFMGTLDIPASELVCPGDSEITAIETMTPAECLAHPNMSKLAKHAIRHMYGESQALDAEVTLTPFKSMLTVV